MDPCSERTLVGMTRRASSDCGATRWAWRLLGARTLALVVAQAVIAGALLLTGEAEPWWRSAAWWPVAATLANVAGAAFLGWRLRVERIGWRRFLAWGEAGRSDAAWMLGLLALVATAVSVPSVALGHTLWGDPSVGQLMLVGPLPSWAAWVALVAFPITTGAVELPTYAGYVLPRLRTAGTSTVAAVLVVGGALGVQHGALPFLPASGFFLWRTLMFVPSALTLIAILAWRPRLLPWWMVAHASFAAIAGFEIWVANA